MEKSHKKTSKKEVVFYDICRDYRSFVYNCLLYQDRLTMYHYFSVLRNNEKFIYYTKK